MRTIKYRRLIQLTPEQIKEHTERTKALRLKYLNEQLEIEALKLSMEPEHRHKTTYARISILDLKIKQLGR